LGGAAAQLSTHGVHGARGAPAPATHASLPHAVLKPRPEPRKVLHERRAGVMHDMAGVGVTALECLLPSRTKVRTGPSRPHV
jgi:hypothetical protein